MYVTQSNVATGFSRSQFPDLARNRINNPLTRLGTTANMSSGAGDMKPNVVFVLGVPGAGKGTQCSLISKTFNYVHLSAGDLLREEKATGSETAQLILKYINEGRIVPVKITVGLLWKAMQKEIDLGHLNFLIDGFPRNEDNKNGWHEMMEDKVNLKYVIFFDCPPEVGVERCLSRGEAGSGRTDDNIASLEKRIVTYREETYPIIEYYSKKNLVKTITADRSKEEVFEDVKKLFS